MRIVIDLIEVGNRRREDLGDIEALAESIERYGLMQPIVIDKDCRLIAGGRRLVACKLLGWEYIEAKEYEDLTDRELRLMELEENVQRKDLTADEKSRNLVDYVEAVTEKLEKEAADLLPKSGNKSQPGKRGRPTKAVSQEKVAERAGIPQATISVARTHVATVDEYPFMKSWSQEKVQEARKMIENLQAEDGDRVMSLLNRKGITHENGLQVLQDLSARSPVSRAAIYDLTEGSEVADLTSALSKLAKEPPSFDPALPYIQTAIKSLRIALEVTRSPGKGTIRKVCDELAKIENEMADKHQHHPVVTV